MAPGPVAYGLRFHGPIVTVPVERSLPRSDAAWPSLEVSYRRADVGSGDDRLSSTDAVVGSIPGIRLRVDRSPMAALVESPALPDPAVTVHPVLARVAAILAYWLNRPAFHGGAVAAPDGRAWVLLGAAGGGKSTLLAALAGLGCEVLADDLVVLDDDGVLAGPRVVSLRPDAAGILAPGRPTVSLGGQRRVRLATAGVADRALLAGWVVLGEGAEVSLTPVPPAARVATLARSAASRPWGATAARLLELSRLPAYRLARPPTWDSLEASATALARLVGTPPRSPARVSPA